MVRRQQFTRDDIVLAGVQVAETLGLGRLSARAVALTLGSSTAPVYSNFRNMGQLEEAVREAAMQLLLQQARSSRTHSRFLDLGVGVLQFALQRPRLYEALFLNSPQWCEQVMLRFHGIVGELPELAALDPFERSLVLKKMAIFTHGLAVDICGGRAGTTDLQMLTLLLGEVGRAVLTDAMAAAKRPAQERRLLESFCASGIRL